MNREARWRAALLETTLMKLARSEERVLADLHSAGFNFQSIAAARRYLSAQHTVARLSHEETVELIARQEEKSA